MTAHLLPKILIVDDDDDLRRIYARYLSAEGFEVFEAHSGEQVLREFRSQKFDIILLDIRIPDTQGHLLLSSLHKSHPHSKIVVSSCYTVEMQKEMIEDAADYFDKSQGCRALLSKIQSILPRTQVSSEA